MFHNWLLQIDWNYRFILIQFRNIFFPWSFPLILHISDLFVAVWLEVTSVRGQAVAVGMIVRLVQALAVALVYERIQLDLKTRSRKKFKTLLQKFNPSLKNYYKNRKSTFHNRHYISRAPLVTYKLVTSKENNHSISSAYLGCKKSYMTFRVFKTFKWKC